MACDLIADTCNNAGIMTSKPIVEEKLSRLSRMLTLMNEFSYESVVAEEYLHILCCLSSFWKLIQACDSSVRVSNRSVE